MSSRNDLEIAELLDPRGNRFITKPTEVGDWMKSAMDRISEDKQSENSWLSLALRRRSPYEKQKV